MYSMERASNENIQQFLTDTLARFMHQDTTGKYKVHWDELSRLKDDFLAATLGSGLGNRVYATGKVGEAIEEIHATASLLHAFIIVAFDDKNTPELMRFFPAGLNGIWSAKRGDYGIILTLWMEKIAKLDAQFKATTWAADIAALKARFDKALEDQSGEKSNVNEALGTVNALVGQLAAVCWKLALAVVSDHLETAESTLKIYFDTAPLERKNHSGGDGR